MKNNFIILLSLIIFNSCTHRDYTRVNSSSEDLFSNESYQRFSKANLEAIAKKDDIKSSPVVLCHLRKFNEAFTLFDQLLEKQKESFNYWNQLAICYMLNNELTKAQLYFKTSLSYASNNKNKAIVYNNLGVLFLKDEDYQQALLAFEESQKLNPQMVTPQFNSAQIFLKFGLVNKARTILFNLLKINSSDNDLLHAVGFSYLLEKNIPKSLEYLDKLNKAYLNRKDFGRSFALVHWHKGQFEQSLDQIKNAKNSTNSDLDDWMDKFEKLVIDKIKQQEKKSKG